MPFYRDIIYMSINVESDEEAEEFHIKLGTIIETTSILNYIFECTEKYLNETCTSLKDTGDKFITLYEKTF